MSLCDDYIFFEESGSSSEQSWLSQEKRFLKVINEFSLLLGITHWKGQGLSFNQNWISFTKECFVRNLIEISPMVPEKSWKMRQVNDYNDRQHKSESPSWTFDSGELKITEGGEFFKKQISTLRPNLSITTSNQYTSYMCSGPRFIPHKMPPLSSKIERP